MGRLVALKEKAGNALLVGADVLGMVLSLAGASVVAVLGKVMLAVVLFALALGFFLRLSGRRKHGALPKPVVPVWARPVAGLAAGIEVALLVEATDLPIRFHQPGFEPWHWLLVLAGLVVAYALHMRLFAALIPRQHVTSRP